MVPWRFFWDKTKGGDIKHYFTVIYHDDSTDSPSFPPKYTFLGQNRFLDHFLKISVPNSVFGSPECKPVIFIIKNTLSELRYPFALSTPRYDTKKHGFYIDFVDFSSFFVIFWSEKVTFNGPLEIFFGSKPKGVT